jgi:hypothetical protein
MWMIVLISLATGQVVYQAPVGASAYGISLPVPQSSHTAVNGAGKDYLDAVGCYKFMGTVANAHNKKFPNDPVRAECHKK